MELNKDERKAVKRYLGGGLVTACFISAIIGLLWLHGMHFQKSKPVSVQGHELQSEDLPERLSVP